MPLNLTPLAHRTASLTAVSKSITRTCPTPGESEDTKPSGSPGKTSWVKGPDDCGSGAPPLPSLYEAPLPSYKYDPRLSAKENQNNLEKSRSCHLILNKFKFGVGAVDDTIPLKSEITGILLEFKYKPSVASQIIMPVAQFTKDTAERVGTPFTIGSPWPLNSPDPWIAFLKGGDGKTFGTTWSQKEIVDDNFGVILQVTNTGDELPATASIKDVKITVWYKAP